MTTQPESLSSLPLRKGAVAIISAMGIQKSRADLFAAAAIKFIDWVKVARPECKTWADVKTDVVREYQDNLRASGTRDLILALNVDRIKTIAGFDPSIAPSVEPGVKDSAVAFGGAKASIEVVTPALAEKWLGVLMEGQRKIKNIRRSLWVNEMRGGRWTLTPDCIGFDCAGNLMNGQHRLLALIDSGTTQPFGVIRGLPENAYRATDRGANRSGYDDLRQDGEALPKRLAAMISVLSAYVDGVDLNRAAVEMTNMRRSEFLAANPEIRDSLKESSGFPKSGRLLTDSTLDLGFYVFSNITPAGLATTRQFFSHFEDGSGMGKNHPILRLRERMIADSGSSVGARARARGRAALLFTAWNAWRKNKEISRLTIPQDAPIPNPI